MLRRTTVALLLLAALAVGGGCGDEGEGSKYGRTFESLCIARQQADTSPATAGDTFNRLVHVELHALADQVSEVDRPLAARLLERKQRVESDLVFGAPGPTLAAGMDLLIGVTRDAVVRLGEDTPTC